ncbi:hypothetical protein [Candidatus Halobonum tyrrellensis]|nr:hypothetical protein [Candidatus Halobonum tyrrellensis]
MLVSGLVLLAVGIATTVSFDASSDVLPLYSREPPDEGDRGVERRTRRSVGLGGAAVAAFGAVSVYGAFAYA